MATSTVSPPDFKNSGDDVPAGDEHNFISANNAAADTTTATAVEIFFDLNSCFIAGNQLAKSTDTPIWKRRGFMG